MVLEKTEIEKQLLIVTSDFLQELSANRALQAVTLDADLDRTLGIDSLGKIELFSRIEKQLSISFPEKVMTEVKCLKDLSTIIENLSPTLSAQKTTEHAPALEMISLDLASATNLVDALKVYAAHVPDRPHIYLHTESQNEQIITYAQLWSEAKKLAEGLAARNVQPGETVGIMLPTDAAFFYAFMGVLLVGAIPVAIYPPFRPDRIEEYAIREVKILQNAQARILITFAQAESLSKLLRNFIPDLQAVVTVQDLQNNTATLPKISIARDAIGLIQYTSGSTGTPKAVTLTHENIMANIHAIGKGLDVKPNDACVSWLPLYHDMGLMNWLGSLYFGIPLTILSPLTFLTHPERWLWAIHYHQATLSGGPNFAYELCIKKIETEEIVGLDLSSWRFAFNGAEAINPKTLESFAKKFAPYGFKAEAFAPVYGLAENTVALTFPTEQRVPRIDKIQRQAYENEFKALRASEDSSDENIIEFVACGKALPDHQVRIVDNANQTLEERFIGNVQFRGPSAMQGYYNNPQATQEIYHQGWWDTGDLGYIADKDLFITGRKKDLIIKAGRNISPEGIEDLIGQLEGVRKGCVAAFGVVDPNSGTEKLIVVAETRQLNKNAQAQLRQHIIERMSIELGIPPDEVVLAKPSTIFKTSSGKLQRSATKDAFIKGKLTQHHLPAQLQVAKLAMQGLIKKIDKSFTIIGKSCYSLYIAILLLLSIPGVWLSLYLLPQRTAGRFCQSWSKIFFRFAACQVSISGEEHLHEATPQVFVANHSSYVDAALLMGILPIGTLFTAKRSLAQTPIIGSVIKKLGYLLIDRSDFAKSIENTKEIEQKLREKHSILIFPEGTFTYATGLRPFKLGAFMLAAETNTPICTISIQGTRSILRGDTWLAKPGLIKITVSKPFYPQKKDFNEVIRLHSLVRAQMAQHCGEPIIDTVVAGPD